MSAVEDNKALLYRYVEEVWDQQNLEAIDDFLSPDYQRHPSPTAEPLTRAGQSGSLPSFGPPSPMLGSQLKRSGSSGRFHRRRQVSRRQIGGVE